MEDSGEGGEQGGAEDDGELSMDFADMKKKKKKKKDLKDLVEGEVEGADEEKENEGNLFYQKSALKSLVAFCIIKSIVKSNPMPTLDIFIYYCYYLLMLLS